MGPAVQGGGYPSRRLRLGLDHVDGCNRSMGPASSAYWSHASTSRTYFEGCGSVLIRVCLCGVCKAGQS
jgi:hypothetical protein